MSKKKRPTKSYPTDVPLPKTKTETSWLLRSLARLLHKIADELQRIAAAW